MCGRFTRTKSSAEVAEAFDVGNMPELAPRYNVAPSATILGVRHGEQGREGFLAHWGLTPSWSDGRSAFPNARGDSVATKPAFRSAFKKRRCLVPADGFFEWKAEGKKKVPHLFTVAGGGLFAIAGLWEGGKELADSACVLTTEANAVVGQVHDRMPVILPRAAWDAWLDPATSAAILQALLRPYPAGEMACRRVSDFVNNARNEGPACVELAAQAALF